jgi:methylmalonyl-CoA mutase
MTYQPKNPIRVVTATALYDGHDVSINLMRRIMQQLGVEVIHLGHNRDAQEIAECAIQEDANAIAVTSYQGGHIEFFKYLKSLLRERDAGHIKIFGGGGGTILPNEIKDLHDFGIDRIYSPEDGTKLGLQGMVADMVKRCDFDTLAFHNGRADTEDIKTLAGLISRAENDPSIIHQKQTEDKNTKTLVLGITGTGGAGKSSVVDELVRRLLTNFPSHRLAIISVDPTKRKSGGALLGDRIRMNAINDPRVFMRSLATRQSNLSLSKHIKEVLMTVQSWGFNLIILESSGIGQSGSEIFDHSDICLYVMTPEYGAATQLEKIDMLDLADFVAINKFDKKGAEDAFKDVSRQYRRNHLLFESEDELPIFGTVASRFNDAGINDLYQAIVQNLAVLNTQFIPNNSVLKVGLPFEIIPENRSGYLSEISGAIRTYNRDTGLMMENATNYQSLRTTLDLMDEVDVKAREALKKKLEVYRAKINNELLEELENWGETQKRYQEESFAYQVRDKKIKAETHTTSLSGTPIPKVILPRYQSWGDLTRWMRQENMPGSFPYTAGVFPFKRNSEEPTRMFAGEGCPERTNRRFHYLSRNQNAMRLSTAFDSVTLYGEDPHERPDVYGKIGNSGVSICTLDDAKKLYSGFDLCAANTSVSMTINGPAAAMCAFFLNAAIDQQCEKYIRKNNLVPEVEKVLSNKYDANGLPRPHYAGKLPEENDGLGLLLLGLSGDEILEQKTYEKIRSETISKVRGTVQADILKEDQAQNTCIFSTDFSLKMMGDLQEYFVRNQVRNFYSISVSGYHIAEAGANPITQLAFTLANGFTYVEYFLSRGMPVDSFAHNLSFFFSNGIDPEYAVIGRVARRIWAKAMKYVYEANSRSQKLKYHIQTSGRSLHAWEISFNDIRTTLQALYAIYDNCNSLHTNAYDEAITTPTESSVRRALAIQLIINRELGLAKNENPLQGSFIIEELTDLVEEAVLCEFDRLSERGGVLGAMERMYQRNKIQEESMHYEKLKHSGEYPIIGVNSFLGEANAEIEYSGEVTRATEDEKQIQIANLNTFKASNQKIQLQSIAQLKQAVESNENIFEILMECVKYCSLGQITKALYEVGGKYRRNM